MSLSRVKVWERGEVLTYSDLNNEFNNILNNGTLLVQPWVGNFDLDGNVLILDANGDTSLDATVNDTIDVTIAGADDFRFTANTFTALSGSSITVASGDVTVTTGNLNVADGQTTLADVGAQTNTVATPLIVEAQTTNSPAAGIGTGVLFKSESADEAPSNFGQVEFVASDVTAGSEDTYFQILSRVAGAALTAVYRFVATGAFKAIFSHANTADRTYTLPNRSVSLGVGRAFDGPGSAGSGSTRTHEGTVTVSSNGNYSGVHYYTDFTLNSSVTMTVPDGTWRLVIIAYNSITINGTIDARGAGQAGAAGSSGSNGVAGSPGAEQAGGGGGGSSSGETGGAGGAMIANGFTFQAGAAAGANATAVSGSGLPSLITPGLSFGGAGGGSGGGTATGPTAGGAGGNGGGTVILIAPTITLGATATIDVRGDNGSGGTAAGGGGPWSGGGGGGGGGLLYIATNNFTDNGAAISLSGGSGGSGGGGSAVAGGSGATGVKQIVIYS